jgi:predicted nucleic acid-binding protein
VTPTVLDSGALSAWAAGDRRVTAALEAVERAGGYVVVPTAVIAESTTGDGGRDATVNRRLKGVAFDVCDETRARRAAALRFECRSAGSVSVVDAIVAATGEAFGATVLTGDPRDLGQLAGVVHDLKVVSLDQLA